MKDHKQGRAVVCLLIAAFAAASLAVAQQPPPPPPPLQAAAHGVVTNAAGRPIAGAVVTQLPAVPRPKNLAPQDRIVTDENGVFSIAVPPPAAGRPAGPGGPIEIQGVQVQAPGYATVIVHRPKVGATRGPIDLGTIVLRRATAVKG
jgi:hypothetical protein